MTTNPQTPNTLQWNNQTHTTNRSRKFYKHNSPNTRPNHFSQLFTMLYTIKIDNFTTNTLAKTPLVSYFTMFIVSNTLSNKHGKTTNKHSVASKTLGNYLRKTSGIHSLTPYWYSIHVPPTITSLRRILCACATCQHKKFKKGHKNIRSVTIIKPSNSDPTTTQGKINRYSQNFQTSYYCYGESRNTPNFTAKTAISGKNKHHIVTPILTTLLLRNCTLFPTIIYTNEASYNPARPYTVTYLSSKYSCFICLIRYYAQNPPDQNCTSGIFETRSVISICPALK
jgi:hypothetical protein